MVCDVTLTMRCGRTAGLAGCQLLPETTLSLEHGVLQALDAVADPACWQADFSLATWPLTVNHSLYSEPHETLISNQG